MNIKAKIDSAIQELSELASALRLGGNMDPGEFMQKKREIDQKLEQAWKEYQMATKEGE